MNIKIDDYKKECFERFDYERKYYDSSKEYLIDELYEKDKEIEKLNNIIKRLGSIFRSMQFSAPENMYAHLDRMANVFQEWLGE